MNQQIFELIQQQNGDCGLVWTEKDKEKFAELLVRECSTLAYDGPNGILEYFGLGVEE